MSMPTTATPTATSTAIDLRTLAPCERHALIFGRFDALQAGQSMQLVNDHNPLPLRFQLEDRAPGSFEWAPMESGPAVWRVQITRLVVKPVAPATDSCCSGGACCG